VTWVCRMALQGPPQAPGCRATALSGYSISNFEMLMQMGLSRLICYRDSTVCRDTYCMFLYEEWKNLHDTSQRTPAILFIEVESRSLALLKVKRA
jgi:hypothetical protein